MKRALRRYRARVEKARRVRILTTHGAWKRVRAWDDDWNWAPDTWKEVGRHCMVEPGWWIHENVIQPSRIRSNQQLQLTLLGQDPEGTVWPDYRKPHLYYW